MKRFSIFLLLTSAALNTLIAQTGSIRIAVAANAQFVISVLQADFKKSTGIGSEAIIGSSGNLSTQIMNGAPFDIFLSADMEFPEKLFARGFAITKPKEYALGSLVVCGIGSLAVNDWRNLVTGNKLSKIAIANPELAPYGKAARQALKYYKIWDQLSSKLVFGESISQVNTYITTGTVDLGFTTEALIYELPDKEKLKWARVDKKAYEPIRQGFVVLGYSKKGNYQNAMKFYDYILSAPAKQIFKRYGYEVL